MKRQHDFSNPLPDEGQDQYSRRPKYGNDSFQYSSFDPSDPNQVSMYNSYVTSLASYYSAIQQHQQQHSQYPLHMYNSSLPYYSTPSLPNFPIFPSSTIPASHNLMPSASLFYQQQFHQSTTNNSLPTSLSTNSITSSSNSSSPLPPSRTIYLGNITEATKHSEIFDLIKCGPVVEVKLLPEKKCAFIEFLDLPTSLTFFNFYSKSLPTISSSPIPLKVAFAKSSSPIPLNIQAAMNAVPPATRVAYVGGLDENQLNESYLMEKFSPYGTIESIRMLKDKKTAFIHFISVSNAIKLVSLFGSSSTTPVSFGLPGSKICYGKDRFPLTSTARTNTEQKISHPLVSGAMTPKLPTSTIPMSQFSIFCMQNSQLFKIPGVPAPFTQNYRTIFLGSIPEETALSELANVIRGGLLFNLKIVPEKNCAFVTFVKASDALLFYVSIVGTKPVVSHLEQSASSEQETLDVSKTNISSDVPGLFVLGRKIYKVGFGKPIDLTSEMLEAIEKGGATRNIYIGAPKKTNDNVFSEELLDETTIISEFSQYGTIESVVRVPEKQVSFVNFANIVSALKAIVGIRSNPIFDNYKIMYGKDRCATPFSTHPPGHSPISPLFLNSVPSIQNLPIPPPVIPGLDLLPSFYMPPSSHSNYSNGSSSLTSAHK